MMLQTLDRDAGTNVARGYPDDVPVPSFGPRLRCERGGHLGADARPNWNETDKQEPITRGSGSAYLDDLPLCRHATARIGTTPRLCRGRPEVKKPLQRGRSMHCSHSLT